LTAQFAMVGSPASAVPACHAGGDAPGGAAEGLLPQVAAGPAFWEDLLGELRRAGLIAELLSDGVIIAAVAAADHGHQLDRALTAEATALCVITGALFPDQGYDMILARTFGMPGLPVKPGTVTPSGPALSKAARSAELAQAFGVPAGGTKPKIRIVAHVRTGSRRWIDGEPDRQLSRPADPEPGDGPR